MEALYKDKETIELKPGAINNKELVEIFGTERQKESYYKNWKLNTGNKTSILNKAKNKCDIEDLGRGKYTIHRVYNPYINEEIIPLKKGLNKYIAPIILNKLLNQQDKHRKIVLPFVSWAKNFEIINENYPIIKYNQQQSSNYLNINQDILFEYFEKMDSCIKYHFNKCLEILKEKADLIDYDTVKMVKKVKIIKDDKINNNINDGMNIFLDYFDEPISDDDRNFVHDCEELAETKANITKKKEKYYGIKSIIYKKELKRLLIKRNILFTFRSYKIFYKNEDKIKEAISLFDDIDLNNEEEFIEAFHDSFLNYIEHKATLRHNKEIEKSKIEDLTYIIKKHRIIETYIQDFKLLSQLTIKKDSESLKDIIKTNENLKELKDCNINVTSSKW